MHIFLFFYFCGEQHVVPGINYFFKKLGSHGMPDPDPGEWGGGAALSREMEQGMANRNAETEAVEVMHCAA
jgi:hypothetical protein